MYNLYQLLRYYFQMLMEELEPLQAGNIQLRFSSIFLEVFPETILKTKQIVIPQLDSELL